MKKFIVDTGNKKYKVEASTYDEAVSAVKAIQLVDEEMGFYALQINGQWAQLQPSGTRYKIVSSPEKATRIIRKTTKSEAERLLIGVQGISNLGKATVVKYKDCLKDEASPLQTVNALLEDERAAVDAYNVALENLKGKIPDESYTAIEAIRNDENRHIENLQAVVNGNVTQKNLEDSIKRINAIDTLIDYASANSDDDYLDSIEKLLRQKVNIYVDAFIDNARGSFHISKNYQQKRNLSRDDLNKMINVLRSSTDLKGLRSENPDRFDAVIRGTIPGYES
jgi:hypothetical protein